MRWTRAVRVDTDSRDVYDVRVGRPVGCTSRRRRVLGPATPGDRDVRAFTSTNVGPDVRTSGKPVRRRDDRSLRPGKARTTLVRRATIEYSCRRGTYARAREETETVPHPGVNAVYGSGTSTSSRRVRVETVIIGRVRCFLTGLRDELIFVFSNVVYDLTSSIRFHHVQSL